MQNQKSKLDKILDQNNMSRYQLIQKTELSGSIIYNFEEKLKSGSITLCTLRKIASSLGVNIEQLI
jgi:DNA-binding Xre family transcriptional regulator